QPVLVGDHERHVQADDEQSEGVDEGGQDRSDYERGCRKGARATERQLTGGERAVRMVDAVRLAVDDVIEGVAARREGGGRGCRQGEWRGEVAPRGRPDAHDPA